MNIKETLPFNFDEVYGYVEQKFKDRGYDTEEGSNAMQLSMAMSYLISSLNANTAVNINETLLPLARKRDNVLLNARVLGYEIQHITSYRYRLTIRLDPGLHTIDQYTKFTSNGLDYYYMGKPLLDIEGTIQLEVLQGELKKWEDNDNLEQVIRRTYNTQRGKAEYDYYLDIPYERVENTGIDAFLTYSDEDGTRHDMEYWSQSPTFVIDKDVKLRKSYSRVDNIATGTPRIYFGVNDDGTGLRENTIVRMNLLISDGFDGEAEKGDMGYVFENDSISGEILFASLVNRGSTQESLDSVKKNAPLFYNSANRLVTQLDYTSFVNRDLRVKSANMWSGADEEPKQAGHIWMSFIPQHTIRSMASANTNNSVYDLDMKDPANWYLGAEDIQAIQDSMTPYSIPTLIYHHRQPVYMDFYYDIKIARYNRSRTAAGWHELVFNVIDEYFRGSDTIVGVETFFYEYFQSSLDKNIDLGLSDETGFTIDLTTKIPISIENYTDDTTDIVFHLGTPFETYIDATAIDGTFNMITDDLPRLDLVLGDYNMYVDFDNLIINEDSIRTRDYAVKFGNDTDGYADIGLYRVYVDSTDTIEVILNTGEIINDPEDPDPLPTDLPKITEQNVLDGFDIEISYTSPNIKFSRNTIPRLKQINFIST